MGQRIIAALIACCLLVALRSDAFMPLAVVTGGGVCGGAAVLDAITVQACGGGNTCTITGYTTSAGTNRKLLVFYAGEDNNTFTATATYNGISMSSAVEIVTTGAAPFSGSGIFYLNDASFPTPGSYDIVVTFSPSAGTMNGTSVAATSWQCLAQGAPSSTASYENAADNAHTASVTSSGTDVTFVAATINQITGTWTHGSGQTERVNTTFSTVPSGFWAVSDEVAEAAPSETHSAAVEDFTMVVAVWAEL